MIIIEGTDCAGKTTLAKALAKELNYEYQHLGVLPFKWNYPWDYKPLIRKKVIQDRFHMSELVYGHLIRNTFKINPMVYHVIDAWLTLTPCITVIIVPPEDRIRELWVQRPQAFTLEETLEVNRMFQGIMWKTQFESWSPIFHITYSEDVWPTQSSWLIPHIISSHKAHANALSKKA